MLIWRAQGVSLTDCFPPIADLSALSAEPAANGRSRLDASSLEGRTYAPGQHDW